GRSRDVGVYGAPSPVCGGGPVWWQHRPRAGPNRIRPRPLVMSFDPRRRDALKAATLAAVAGGLGLVPGSPRAGGDARPSAADAGAIDTAAEPGAWNHLRLWYPRPATQWVEALPLGNGALGALVWGGVW